MTWLFVFGVACSALLLLLAVLLLLFAFDIACSALLAIITTCITTTLCFRRCLSLLYLLYSEGAVYFFAAGRLLRGDLKRA